MILVPDSHARTVTATTAAWLSMSQECAMIADSIVICHRATQEVLELRDVLTSDDIRKLPCERQAGLLR